MLLYILISLIIILLLWMMFVPVIIFINTDRDRYLLTLPGIFRAVLVPTPDFFYIRLWVFFLPIKIDPLKIKKRKKGKAENQVKSKKKSSKRFGNINIIQPAIQTFRIRKLWLDIDSNDFLLNAALVPAFSMVNHGNILMQVNFDGNLFLHLETRARIGSLLWILFKYR